MDIICHDSFSERKIKEIHVAQVAREHALNLMQNENVITAMIGRVAHDKSRQCKITEPLPTLR